MGGLEQKSKRRKKKRNFQKYILATIQTAGVLSIALVAPNVLGGFKKLGLLPNPRDKESIKASRERLVKKGWLSYSDGKLRLTPQGEVALRRMQVEDLGKNKPKKWDGMWRVLIFDIPEKRKNLRDKIRLTLLSLGFLRLQDSVWVYPYDCEDFITLLKADFKVGKDVLYIIADSVENDLSIKKHFGLFK